MKKGILILVCCSLFLVLSGCKDEGLDEKPVIYLYPTEKTEVRVELTALNGELSTTYPKYENGWQVMAEPSGLLKDHNGKEYNYLYWEGNSKIDYDFTHGFCIKGEDTAQFLEKSLDKLGLNRKEANEFIVYWLPEMEKNSYNLIAFQKEKYTDSYPLKVEPKPDTMIRVFMAWKPLKQKMEIPEQDLTAPQRNGFTLVEWGGAKTEN